MIKTERERTDSAVVRDEEMSRPSISGSDAKLLGARYRLTLLQYYLNLATGAESEVDALTDELVDQIYLIPTPLREEAFVELVMSLPCVGRQRKLADGPRFDGNDE